MIRRRFSTARHKPRPTAFRDPGLDALVNSQVARFSLDAAIQMAGAVFCQQCCLNIRKRPDGDYCGYMVDRTYSPGDGRVAASTSFAVCTQCADTEIRRMASTAAPGITYRVHRLAPLQADYLDHLTRRFSAFRDNLQNLQKDTRRPPVDPDTISLEAEWVRTGNYGALRVPLPGSLFSTCAECRGSFGSAGMVDRGVYRVCSACAEAIDRAATPPNERAPVQDETGGEVRPLYHVTADGNTVPVMGVRTGRTPQDLLRARAYSAPVVPIPRDLVEPGEGMTRCAGCSDAFPADTVWVYGPQYLPTCRACRRGIRVVLREELARHPAELVNCHGCRETGCRDLGHMAMGRLYCPRCFTGLPEDVQAFDLNDAHPPAHQQFNCWACRVAFPADQTVARVERDVNNTPWHHRYCRPCADALDIERQRLETVAEINRINPGTCTGCGCVVARDENDTRAPLCSHCADMVDAADAEPDPEPPGMYDLPGEDHEPSGQSVPDRPPRPQDENGEDYDPHEDDAGLRSLELASHVSNCCNCCGGGPVTVGMRNHARLCGDCSTELSSRMTRQSQNSITMLRCYRCRMDAPPRTMRLRRLQGQFQRYCGDCITNLRREALGAPALPAPVPTVAQIITEAAYQAADAAMLQTLGDMVAAPSVLPGESLCIACGRLSEWVRVDSCLCPGCQQTMDTTGRVTIQPGLALQAHMAQAPVSALTSSRPGFLGRWRSARQARRERAQQRQAEQQPVSSEPEVPEGWTGACVVCGSGTGEREGGQVRNGAACCARCLLTVPPVMRPSSNWGAESDGVSLGWRAYCIVCGEITSQAHHGAMMMNGPHCRDHHHVCSNPRCAGPVSGEPIRFPSSHPAAMRVIRGYPGDDRLTDNLPVCSENCARQVNGQTPVGMEVRIVPLNSRVVPPPAPGSAAQLSVALAVEARAAGEALNQIHTAVEGMQGLVNAPAAVTFHQYVCCHCRNQFTITDYATVLGHRPAGGEAMLWEIACSSQCRESHSAGRDITVMSYREGRSLLGSRSYARTTPPPHRAPSAPDPRYVCLECQTHFGQDTSQAVVAGYMDNGLQYAPFCCEAHAQALLIERMRVSVTLYAFDLSLDRLPVPDITCAECGDTYSGNYANQVTFRPQFGAGAVLNFCHRDCCRRWQDRHQVDGVMSSHGG